MPSSIAAAEAKIRSLRKEIVEYTEKVSACGTVIAALQNDRSVLIEHQGTGTSAQTKAQQSKEKIEISRDKFSNESAYNVDPTGLNSNDFQSVTTETETFQNSMGDAMNTISTVLGEVEAGIETATENKEKWQKYIISCQREIAALEAWIEEERRRQEEISEV